MVVDHHYMLILKPGHEEPIEWSVYTTHTHDPDADDPHYATSDADTDNDDLESLYSRESHEFVYIPLYQNEDGITVVRILFREDICSDTEEPTSPIFSEDSQAHSFQTVRRFLSNR
jgi:hypothetical protein